MRGFSLAGEQDYPGFSGIGGGAKCFPVRMANIFNMLEIIHSGALQAAVAERKSTRFYDINCHAKAGTSP